MIRTLSFTLGFLIAASSVYYVVFWGHFNIDVFQYIQAPDIIKGLAYPVKDSYDWLLFLSLEFVVTVFYVLYSNSKEDDLNHWMAIVYYRRAIELLFKATVSVFSIALICGVIFYTMVTNNACLQYAVSLSNLTVPLVVITGILAYLMLETKNKLRRLKNNEPSETQSELVTVLNILIISFTMYFFASEISYGMINSRKIDARMSYDYVVTNGDWIKEGNWLKGGANINDTLIYLGAISDRYVFLKKDKPSYFVVDKYHLPVLLINHDSRKNKDLSIWDESIKGIKRNTSVQYVLCAICVLFIIYFYKLVVWALEKIAKVFNFKNYNEMTFEDMPNEVRKMINKWLKKRLASRKRKLRK
jgi:Ca2+/Na+ antiporter